MPLARLWWLLDRNCDLVHTEITENTEKTERRAVPIGAARFVLSLRIVKDFGDSMVAHCQNKQYLYLSVIFLVFLHPT
jgi:hypothetical protein